MKSIYDFMRELRDYGDTPREAETYFGDFFKNKYGRSPTFKETKEAMEIYWDASPSIAVAWGIGSNNYI